MKLQLFLKIINVKIVVMFFQTVYIVNKIDALNVKKDLKLNNLYFNVILTGQKVLQKHNKNAILL